MHRHIGIYAGTFDPVHAGHIAFANEAKRLLQLDKVIFLPERFPRQKQHVTPIGDRQKLLNDTLQNQAGLASLQLPADQFTVQDTLPELHRLFPSSKFVFLLGSDVVLHLSKWEGLSRLLGEVSFIIAVRKEDSAKHIEQALQTIEGSLHVPIKYTIIDSPMPALASSQMRNNHSD